MGMLYRQGMGMPYRQGMGMPYRQGMGMPWLRFRAKNISLIVTKGVRKDKKEVIDF